MNKSLLDKHTIIIGGGPGGSSAAIYLARTCWPTTLIDAGDKVYGRTRMATDLQNFLGHTTPIAGEDFIKNVRNQINRYPIDQINAKVTKVRKMGGYFHVLLDDNNELISKYLVVAVGVEDVMPDIPGLEPYFEHSIFHCLTCDWYRNKDKPAIYITDSDSGLESVVARVTMNRPKSCNLVPASSNYHFSPKLLERASNLGVNTYSFPIKSLEGDDGYLKGVILKDDTVIASEVVFTLLGHKRLDHFLDRGGINLDRDLSGFIMVDFKTLESSASNLFAVGPCNQGHDQAIIAAGQGATVAEEIHLRILASLGL